MKSTIQAFLDSGKVAIAGASPKKDNFGKFLMTELHKNGKEVYAVNPNYDKIEAFHCAPSVTELPAEYENLILAVPPELSEEIARQTAGSGIKRVWMIKGIGKGAYSDKAHATFKENQIEVVYGFCPMMFFGGGGHKFHLWLRKTFTKLPGEYLVSSN